MIYNPWKLGMGGEELEEGVRNGQILTAKLRRQSGQNI